MSSSVALGVTMALFLQPDAAQATAFAVGSVILLLPDARRSAPRLLCLASIAVIAGLSWLRRDPLAPVPHVEEIVGLAGDMGPGWAVLAVVSLALLPVPFLLSGRRPGSRAALAVGAYVGITCLAPLVGSFPVPVMGFGASPILGYFLALGALPRTQGAALDGPDAPAGSVRHRLLPGIW